MGEIWSARRDRAWRRDRRSEQLAYELPALVVTKERPLAFDFGAAAGRCDHDDVCGPKDSPREGDVLVLEVHRGESRDRQTFDMGQQVSRSHGACELGSALESDELALSPELIHRQVPTLVNMKQSAGRPDDIQLSAHLWTDEDGKLYAYQPSVGLKLHESNDDMLFSETLPGNALRRPANVSDFSAAPGRPGIDPRVPDLAADGKEDSVLFTHWQEPFEPPFLPSSTMSS